VNLSSTYLLNNLSFVFFFVFNEITYVSISLYKEYMCSIQFIVYSFLTDFNSSNYIYNVYTMDKWGLN